MTDRFASSRLKIERAYKHISEINSVLIDFANTDFHTVTVEFDPKTGARFLYINVQLSKFPSDDIALIVGDALHNLRSSLDHFWYRVVRNPSDFTRFPVFDTRDGLVNFLRCCLEKQQITTKLSAHFLDNVRPYQGGHPYIWGLHNLNIRDKHESFIPSLKFMGINGLCLENNEQMPFNSSDYFFDSSFRLPLEQARQVKVKNKGKPSATVLFAVGTPFEGQAIIPTLNGIAEELVRIIDEFPASE